MAEQVTAPLTEWGPVLAKIRQNPPGLIFHADYIPGDLASFQQQFRSDPTPSLMYQQYGPSIPEYLELAGTDADGVIWSTVIGTLPDSDRARRSRTRTARSTTRKQVRARRVGSTTWSICGRRPPAWLGTRWTSSGERQPQAHPLPRGQWHVRFKPGELTAIPYPDEVNDPSLGMAAPDVPDPGPGAGAGRPDPYTRASSSCPHGCRGTRARNRQRRRRYGATRGRGPVQAVRRSGGGRRPFVPVATGEAFGIAGPNGAGKTTLFDTISGHAGAKTGRIVFRGQEIQERSPHAICHLGIARTFQIPAVFPEHTVLGNILVGAYFGRRSRVVPGTSSTGTRSSGRRTPRRSLGLQDKLGAIAGPLSLFDKKRLMIASAIATDPRLLMLDEPVGGLNPGETDEVLELVRQGAGLRGHGRAHRARHAGPHVDLRPRHGDEPRTPLVRGHAGRCPAARGGYPRLPRHRHGGPSDKG